VEPNACDDSLEEHNKDNTGEDQKLLSLDNRWSMYFSMSPGTLSILGA
jgi:hypothetical protein